MGPYSPKGGAIMQKYELGVVIRPTLSEEAVQGVVEKLKSTITAQGGTVHNVDFWGRRKLAYPIDKQKEGYYVFIQFSLSPRNVAEVSRVARYTEDILRHILVKEEEKPEKPAVAQVSDASTQPE